MFVSLHIALGYHLGLSACDATMTDKTKHNTITKIGAAAKSAFLIMMELVFPYAQLYSAAFASAVASSPRL